MDDRFFAFLSRMKYIYRWGLMRNTETENLKEHSFSVAVTAHALGIIANTYFDGDVNPDRLAVYALFHDAAETITGDMPTPVKYFSESMRSVYGEVEKDAYRTLENMLPEEMRSQYSDIICGRCTDREKQLIKAADVIDAYIKCAEECRSGNAEFASAKESTLKKLRSLNCKEADFFMEKFGGAFEKTLDQLRNE